MYYVSICDIKNSFTSIFFHFYRDHVATSMVLLNCNFIFTHMIWHGTMTILQCIPMCVCVDHAYWCHVIYTSRGSTCMSRGSTCVKVRISWKHTHGSTRVEQNTYALTCKTYLPSLSHYITSIFCCLTSTMSRIISSVVHIKS